jgi:hypothetical protein
MKRLLVILAGFFLFTIMLSYVGFAPKPGPVVMRTPETPPAPSPNPMSTYHLPRNNFFPRDLTPEEWQVLRETGSVQITHYDEYLGLETVHVRRVLHEITYVTKEDNP